MSKKEELIVRLEDALEAYEDYGTKIPYSLANNILDYLKNEHSTKSIFPPPVEDFEICWPSYLSDRDPTKERRYDIVKWEHFPPRKVIDGKTGKEKYITESCYTVGWVYWNDHEPCFEFESCGLRWLEANPSPAVVQMVLDFCEKMTEEFEKEDRYE